MVSAVLRIPTAALAFASQHSEWRDCLLGCPCQLLCDLPSFQEEGNKKQRRVLELLSYQALRCVYHISFIFLCRIRLIFLTSFV